MWESFLQLTPNQHFFGIGLVGYIFLFFMIRRNKGMIEESLEGTDKKFNNTYYQFNLFYFLSFSALLILSGLLNNYLALAFFCFIYFLAYKSFETLNIIGQPAKVTNYTLAAIIILNLVLFNQLYYLSLTSDLLLIGLGAFSMISLNLIMINHSTAFISFKIRKNYEMTYSSFNPATAKNNL
jgi:hypothetical protein